MLLLAVIGIIPCMIVGRGIIGNYEKRAVSMRTAEIQNQSTMLGGRLGKSGYLNGVPSESLDAELSQLADIYSGRILLIDDEFRVIKDTYEMEEGRTVVSESVITCYKGKNTSEYDSKNHYIEVTQAIENPNTGKLEGIMLVSVSTDTIVDSVEVLRSKAVAVELAVGVGALFAGVHLDVGIGDVEHLQAGELVTQVAEILGIELAVEGEVGDAVGLCFRHHGDEGAGFAHVVGFLHLAPQGRGADSQQAAYEKVSYVHDSCIFKT